MIHLENLSKSFGGDHLFSGVDWQIPPGEAIGLVGPNGAGKTTLFRLLIGEEAPDSGAINVPKHLTIGHLAQEVAIEEDGTLLEIILGGRPDLLEMESRLRELSDRIAGGENEAEIVAQYSGLEDRFRREGGYELRSIAAQIADGLGFTQIDHDRPIHLFSGGWRMRAVLARLLLRRPDLLLLDEPTNHLDIESIEWLEQFLKTYPGTIIVISHDRFFLNRLVSKVVELHAGKLSIYSGDYDSYLRKRDERREQLLAEKEAQDKEIARIEEFIERFRYKATKAAQVQSRIKQLEKIKPIAVPPAYNREIGFQFPAPPRIGKIVVDAREITKRFGETTIYEGIDFQLGRGDHVAFVGPNGAGKSTLLKMLAGVLAPDDGEVHLGHRVEIAYFAQHSVDQLDLSNTILEEMEASASFEATPRIRSILGAFLFSGDEVHKKISVLSGGEKSRLALAKMLLEPAGCLLLDEPTNHLDIPSRRILEHALREFDGAFCVISHDRYFLNQVVNRVVHIEHGALQDYPGSYEEYRWRRAHGLANEMEKDAPGEGCSAVVEESRSRKDLRRLRAELRKKRDQEIGGLKREVTRIEGRIELLEATIHEFEVTLANPATYQDASGVDIGRLQKARGEAEDELMEVMQCWEELGSELEGIEKKYAAQEAALEE